MEEGKQKKGRPQRRGRGPRGPYQVSGTPKQLRYMAELVAGKSKRRAAHDAGYKGCPRRAVADLDRAAFNRAVHEAANACGITLEAIAKKLRELMDAMERKSFLTQSGEIVYAKEQGMADVQLKAVIIALDVLGISGKARQAVADEKYSAGDAVNVLNLAKRFEHLSDEELEEAMRIMQNRMTGTSAASPNAINAEERDC